MEKQVGLHFSSVILPPLPLYIKYKERVHQVKRKILEACPVKNIKCFTINL